MGDRPQGGIAADREDLERGIGDFNGSPGIGPGEPFNLQIAAKIFPNVAAFKGMTCRASMTFTFAPFASSSFATAVDGFVTAALISAVRPLLAARVYLRHARAAGELLLDPNMDHINAVEPNAFCALTSAL